MNDLLTSAGTVLSATPARWATLTQTIPFGLIALPPAPGEWSALECLQHLVDTEPVFRFRIDAFLAGRDLPAFDPDTQGTKPDPAGAPADLADTFTRLRLASLEALSRLKPDDLDRQAVHQELGRVTLSQMLHEWAAHDLMHTVQAERALMQPFIQGSGPWIEYFRDHIAVAPLG